MVLYMLFDGFLLAVDSCDLSQADKSIIRVSSFPTLQNFNFSIIVHKKFEMPFVLSLQGSYNKVRPYYSQKEN